MAASTAAVTSDYTGTLREAVFGLPLQTPAGSQDDWFAPQFLGQAGHPIHRAGVRANTQCSRWMNPVTSSWSMESALRSGAGGS